MFAPNDFLKFSESIGEFSRVGIWHHPAGGSGAGADEAVISIDGVHVPVKGCDLIGRLAVALGPPPLAGDMEVV